MAMPNVNLYCAKVKMRCADRKLRIWCFTINSKLFLNVMKTFEGSMLDTITGFWTQHVSFLIVSQVYCWQIHSTDQYKQYAKWECRSWMAAVSSYVFTCISARCETFLTVQTHGWLYITVVHLITCWNILIDFAMIDFSCFTTQIKLTTKKVWWCCTPTINIVCLQMAQTSYF